MIAFKDLPISKKLTRMSMVVSASVLLLSCTAFIGYELLTFKNTAAERLSTNAEIIGINVTPALLFQDHRAAAETLAALRATPNIISAAVYTPDGNVFATYLRGVGSDAAALPDRLDVTHTAHRIESGHLIVLRQILSDGKPLGMVYIQSDLREIESRVRVYAVIAVSVLTVSFIVALLVSSLLERKISGPILSLAATTRTIALKKDYSVRTAIESKDEIGILSGSFNEMLQQIEEQNATLQKSVDDQKRAEERIRQLNAGLEQRVAERTAELRESREQFRAVAETANDAIFSADESGCIIHFNQAASKLFAYAIDEAIGQPITILMPESFHDAYRNGMKRYLSTGEAPVVGRTTELTGRRKDAAEFPMELSLASWRSGDRTFFTGIIRDITERKQAGAKLLAANQFLDSVIENIPAMIFVKDATDLRFVRVNRAEEELLGHSREDLIGKSDYDLFPKEQADFFTGKDREVLASGSVMDIPEEPILTRTKGERLLHTKKLSILDEHGRPRYLLGICQDVTEQKEKEREILRLNATLEKHAAEVEAANRAKTTFLATMSHEIRTPMNGVLGMVELLALTRLDAEQRTTLEIVRESGKSLLRIIDDILDFSKIEAGRLEVRPEAASIKEVIEGVFNIYSGNASSKGLLLKPVVDPQISPAVWVDPWRLRQILNNFVSNAIKFTTAGTIEIKAELIERVDAEDRVRLSVKDTGIGISPENQRQLFQPFSQAESETTRRYGGTGLGLAICRRLGELMGGSIEMVSELGKGTTMILTVLLPIANPEDLPKTEPKGARDLVSTTTRMRRLAPSMSQAEKEGTLVLVVDDHPTNRLLLMRQVKTLGYAAESAENGVDALGKWKSGRFKIVITDCNMPEMDGYELARSIRRLESANGGKRTPIIACTANALGGEAEICFAAGMDGYLAKPVDLTELLKKLDQWLPIPETEPAPSEQSGSRSEASAQGAAEPVDRSMLAEISDGDAATEREILLDFRRVNDEDAAMLKQAVTNSDIPQVTRASHRIKGACKMVGAMGLASVCEHIEHASRANDWNTIKVYMGAFHQEWIRLNAYFDSL